jgi:tight adherence protein B
VHATAAAAVEFTSAVAGHLRIGAAAETAIERAASEVTELRLKEATTSAVTAIRLGADPVRTMQQIAVLPGCQVFAWCGAAWRVAEKTGGSLATTIESIAETGRAEELQRQSVAAALAGPRATARLLAMLPFAGLALGTALGADPLGMLLHTPVGAACSAGGILLQYAGLRWTAALVSSAERMA